MKHAWFIVDFHSYAIKLSYYTLRHYTLRHYSSWDTEALRNWRLEGSTDGQHWIIIREYHNDAFKGHLQHFL